jgi:hypothetical protein
LGAYLEGAGSGFGEAVAAVKGDGAEISGMGAEEEAGAVEGAGVGDGGVHEGLGGAKVGDRRTVGREDGRGAEAGEEVDALEFDVGRQDVEGGEFGSTEHGVADGGAGLVGESEGGAGDGEGDASVGMLEVVLVGGDGVMLGGMGGDVGAGEHPGEGFEEGGGADEGERGRVGGGGAAESDGFDGIFDGVKVHARTMVVEGEGWGSVEL